MLLLILGLALLGFATALAVRAVTRVSVEASERVASIDAYGYVDSGGAQLAPRPSLRRAFDSIADSFGRALAPRLDSFSEEDVTNNLRGAGIRDLEATTFLGYQAFSALTLPVALALLTSAAGTATPLAVLAVIFGAATGWVLPNTLLRTRADRRRHEIEIALPDLIDLLVLMVEAGLGFSGSMRMAAGRIQGPLGDELRLTLQEQNMGLSTKDALTNLLDRCDTPSMRSFVRSVLQGETLGVSIGAILRNLADDMRKRRRQLAEERAQKAPIKMLFPLVFLIFPPIFIVLLYPAFTTLTDTLGS
jgi:tight adherence protein C